MALWEGGRSVDAIMKTKMVEGKCPHRAENEWEKVKRKLESKGRASENGR